MILNRRWQILVGTILMAAVMGCGQKSAPPAASNSSESDNSAKQQNNFASRLEAAKAISSTLTRDESLSKLAADAAAGGDGEVAKKAVELINSSLAKDSAASNAALVLGKGGKSDQANVLARLIGNSLTRDQTLAKIAKGDFGN